MQTHHALATTIAAVLAAQTFASLDPSNTSKPETDSVARIAALEQAVSNLMKEKGESWLTEQRATEIRAVVQDLVNDADTRASLQSAQATSGYEKGFFIASPDGNFRLKLGGQLQIRWAGSFYSSRDTSILNNSIGSGITRNPTPAVPGTTYNKNDYGFEARRVKLDFSGHAIDPSWQFRMVLVYSQTYSQISGGASAGGNNSSTGLEDAYIRKILGDGFFVQVGQFKAPFLKEELTSSKYQLAIERSIVNTMFNTKFTQGVMAEWRSDDLLVQASFNDGGNNANTSSISGSTNTEINNNGLGFAEWAATGRVAYKPFGEWKQFDDMTSFRGEEPGLMIGLAANWQRGGQSTGGLSEVNSMPLNGNSDGAFLTWTADVSYDLGGANLYSAFVMNTAYSLPAGDPSINSFGLVLQGGYFLTDNLETFCRYEWMQTSNEGYNNIESNRGNTASGAGLIGRADVFNAGRVNIATVGANYFIGGNKNVKLSTDLGWTFGGNLWFNTGIYGQNIGGAEYRIEPKGGGGEIVARVQLQLLY